MPVRAEVQRRAEYLGQAMKTGLSPLWAMIGVAITLIGGSLTLAALWGVKHLIWTPIIVLLVLLAVLAEGSYREARRRETEHAAQVAELKGERDAKTRELEAARRETATAPTALNPAEWIATCDESGDFPNKAMVFNLRHRFENLGARQAFGPLRCVVTDPGGIRVEATGMARFYQYVDPIFPSAPPVRPGLYHFLWQGRRANGEWVEITEGEHEVQPPPKTGLEVVIDMEIPTPFPGQALVVEIEYHVTNHDRVPHILRPALRGVNLMPTVPTDTAEYARVLQAYGMISDRRRGDGPPRSVQPGETVRGVYVTTFSWNPNGKFPDYTLIIRDERQAYTARPTGAGEDPLAEWPISVASSNSAT